MKESDAKSLASYSGPESCAYNRKAVSEALTGVYKGGVLNRESRRNHGNGAEQLPCRVFLGVTAHGCRGGMEFLPVKQARKRCRKLDTAELDSVPLTSSGM